MILVGITGKIGCGKSTISKILRTMGYKVFDADRCSKNIIKQKKVINQIKKSYETKIPNLVNSDYKINTQALGDLVFYNEKELKNLEQIIHPLIKLKEKKFLFNCAINQEKIVFLDIPLLFQNKSYKKCDYIIYAYVNKIVQENRVLSREFMNKKKYEEIKKRQITRDLFIKKKIFLTINTGSTIFNSRKRIIRFLTLIKNKKKKHVWPIEYNFYNRLL